MSYQALYRKWRPRTFDDVKGQDAIIATLKNQIISGRIGHAYLFCGTRGTGKTSVAKILARAVNCDMPSEGNPCNSCDICKSILNESSMNVMEIDAASNNGVDNIRDIRDQVQYPPTAGKYKVFIIDEVHMLSAGAFNALLKTLEEPPEYVIFILATTEVHKIPVTVLSRCQRYDFKRISADTISARILELAEKEKIDIDEKACAYIAKQADGGMRDALSILDECVAFTKEGERITYDKVLEILGTADTAVFAELFDAICGSFTVKALKIIEKAVTEGKELSQFTTDFLWFLRNLLVIRTADDPTGIVDASKENMEAMRACAEKASPGQLMRYIRVIAELINKMRYSGQKRVLLELAVIKLMTPAMEKDSESILERLSELESKMAAGIPVRTYEQPGEKKEIKPEPEKIKLSKAKYDDLMLLKKDWEILTDSMTGLARSMLKGTRVEAEGGDSGRLLVVFGDSERYDLADKDSLVKQLEAAASERYGKEFSFGTSLNKTKKETEYVTEQELRALINMDIEIEEE